MLATRAPLDYKVLKYPLAAEIRTDGLRCICVVYNGKINLYSRSGVLLRNFQEINDVMQGMPEAVYDGEILAEDMHKLVERAFAEVNTHTDIAIEYTIFDKLTHAEWVGGKSKRTYTDRCIKQDIGKRVIINNAAELEVYYNFILKEGHIGLVLKGLDSIYETGKNNHWLYLTPDPTIDMEIIAIDSGILANVDRVYGITCVGEFKGSEVTCYLTRGFTEEQRLDMWEKANALRGKLIKVAFKEMTKANKFGTRSLVYATFKGIMT